MVNVNVEDSDDNHNIYEPIRQIRSSKPLHFHIAHLNINSFRKKFGHVYNMLIYQLVDCLVSSETKLDDTFPAAQFQIPNYTLIERVEMEMRLVYLCM